MFRTKKDVDEHVSDILGRIKNENERTLRYFNVAKLYYGVKEYEAAKRYLAGFLSIQENHAGAHKLFGQIYEDIGDTEKAIECYKRSFNINTSQKNLLLKICDLFCQVPVKDDGAKFWQEKAEKYFPHHEVVSTLKDHLISNDGKMNALEREEHYAEELVKRPKDASLRMRLLRLYISEGRFEDAYYHAMQVETRQPYHENREWYLCLIDIVQEYMKHHINDCGLDTYIVMLEAQERLVALCLEDHDETSPSESANIAVCADALFRFDQTLYKATHLQDEGREDWTAILNHSKGQLYMYSAILLLKRCQQLLKSWKDAADEALMCFIIAYTFKELEKQSNWYWNASDGKKKLYDRWFNSACFRLSQTGHMIQELCGLAEPKRRAERVMQKYTSSSVGRESIFHSLFFHADHRNKKTSSYFAQNEEFNKITLGYPVGKDLKEYDKISHLLYPESLHHLVWLALQEYKDKTKLQPDYGFKIFDNLQSVCTNPEAVRPETLCVLDTMAFVYATVYTTAGIMQEASRRIEMAKPSILPVIISPRLCTAEQANWWSASYKLYTNTARENLASMRVTLQRGLEVIRVTGYHGMNIHLVAHLARTFQKLAEEENGHNTPRRADLSTWASMYWKPALGMLEKMNDNRVVRIPKQCLFAGNYTHLLPNQIKEWIEEGRYFMGCEAMLAGRKEEALEQFDGISLPDAAYKQGLILKSLATEENGDQEAEAFLSKALDSLYLALDRVRKDRFHPLNNLLAQEIEHVESRLQKLRSGSGSNSSEESWQEITRSEISRKGSEASQPVSHSTPFHPQHLRREDRPGLYPTLKGLNTNAEASPLIIGYSSKTKHVLPPSPERLEAQMRALSYSQDTIIRSVMEQNKTLVDSNKAIVQELKQQCHVIEQLKHQLERLELRESSRHLEVGTRQRLQKPATSNVTPGRFIDYKGAEPIGATPVAHLHKYLSKENGGEDDFDNYFYEGDECDGEYDHYYDDRQYQEDPQVAPSQFPIGQYPYHGAYAAAYGQIPAVDASGVPYPGHPQAHYATGPHPGYPSSHMVQPNALFNYYPAARGASPLMPAGVPAPIMQSTGPNPLIQGTSTFGYYPPARPGTVTGLSFTDATNLPHFQFPHGQGFMSNTSSTTSLSNVASTSTLTATLPATTISTADTKPQITTVPAMITASSSSGSHKFQIALPPDYKPPVVQASPTASIKIQPSLVRTRHRTLSTTSEGDVSDHEPSIEFTPVIPLPDVVDSYTGEEDEVPLFAERGKLFRFTDKEWKERGIGIMKILNNPHKGTIRILMRREQVLKVCANHYIQPDMSLSIMPGNEKAWIWRAVDFAEEKALNENFCIRFKTPEIAQDFKLVFDQARQIVSKTGKVDRMDAIPEKTASENEGFGDQFKPKAGVWNCEVCLVYNSKDKTACMACNTPKPTSFTTPPAAAKSVNGSQTPDLANTGAAGVKFGAASAPTQLFGTGSTSFTFGLKPATTGSGITAGIPVTTTTVVEVPGSLSSRETFVQQTPALTALSSYVSKYAGENENASHSSTVSNPLPGQHTSFGGFKFTSPPKIGQTIETPVEVSATVTKPDTTAKSSPFAGFKFPSSSKQLVQTPTTSQDDMSQNADPKLTDVTPGYGASQQTEIPVFGDNTSLDFATLAAAQADDASFKKTESFAGFEGAGTRVFTHETSGTEGEYEPDVDFKPIIALPELIEVKTGEENEEVLFRCRSKLYRFHLESKEWKERGIGEIKILKHKQTGRFRVLMRREQVHKLCANHHILPTMNLNPLEGSNKFWTWHCVDFSEETPKQELFAAKFKTEDQAAEFKQVFEDCQQQLHETSETKPDAAVTEESVEAPKGQTSDQIPLSVMFKSRPGSWNCEVCLVNNPADMTVCAACATPKAGSSEQLLSDRKPLSELFRSKPGSWNCDACYLNNAASVQQCIACNTPKPGSEAPTSSDADAKETDASQSTVGMPKQDIKSVFGQTAGTGFNFGLAPSRSDASSFSFGAPTTTSDDKIGFKLPDKSSTAVDSTSLTDASEMKTPFTSGFLFGAPKDKTTSDAGFRLSDSLSSTGNVTSFTSADTSGTKPVTATGFLFGAPKDKTDNVGFKLPDASSMENISSTSSVADEAKPTQSVFTFGSSGSSNQFKFDASKPMFTIGSSGLRTTDIGEDQLKAKPAPFTFSPAKTPPSSTQSSAPFQFGGSALPSEFVFSGVQPSSPVKSPGRDESDLYHSEGEGDHIYFEPVIPLPEKIDVKTGEENEDILYSHRAKLFRFSDSEWKERGLGDIKILQHKDTKAVRLLLRRERVMKIACNHYITSEMNLIEHDERSWMWCAMDSTDGAPVLEKFAIRFKTSEIAVEFKAAFDDAKARTSSTSPVKSKEVDAEKPISEVDVSSKDDVKDEKANETKPEKSSSITTFSFKSNQKESPSSGFSFGQKFGTASSTAGQPSIFGTPKIALSPGSVFGSPATTSSSVFGGGSVFGGKAALTTTFGENNTTSFPGFTFGGAQKAKVPEASQDVIIVYEKKATPDKVAAARKLQLPDNFYLYEDAPGCPGCRGCHPDDLHDSASPAQETSGWQDSEKEVAHEKEVPKQFTPASFADESEGEAAQRESGIMFGGQDQGSSFADLAKTAGETPSFVKSSDKPFRFSGAGTAIFGHSTNEHEGEDGVIPSHDVHFEPVIPLPELIDVKTGEEEEEKLFCHRAKLYRYDKTTNQWKERGIGDMKILKNQLTGKYRLLLRREQIFKLACNHLIMPEMELLPMLTSETAWCWNALDYSEAEPHLEQFAVRFKEKGTATEFKTKFEEAKKELSTASSIFGADTVKGEDQSVMASVQKQPEAGDNKDVTEEETEEDDEEEILFEKRVNLQCSLNGNEWKTAGMGVLHVLFDDDVYGTRLRMKLDDGKCVMNHVITREINLTLDEKNRTCQWMATDFSTENGVLQSFLVQFSSVNAMKEFLDIFGKGKQLAKESELSDRELSIAASPHKSALEWIGSSDCINEQSSNAKALPSTSELEWDYDGFQSYGHKKISRSKNTSSKVRKKRQKFTAGSNNNNNLKMELRSEKVWKRNYTINITTMPNASGSSIFIHFPDKKTESDRSSIRSVDGCSTRSVDSVKSDASSVGILTYVKDLFKSETSSSQLNMCLDDFSINIPEFPDNSKCGVTVEMEEVLVNDGKKDCEKDEGSEFWLSPQASVVYLDYEDDSIIARPASLCSGANAIRNVRENITKWNDNYYHLTDDSTEYAKIDNGGGSRTCFSESESEIPSIEMSHNDYICFPAIDDSAEISEALSRQYAIDTSGLSSADEKSLTDVVGAKSRKRISPRVNKSNNNGYSSDHEQNEQDAFKLGVVMSDDGESTSEAVSGASTFAETITEESDPNNEVKIQSDANADGDILEKSNKFTVGKVENFIRNTLQAFTGIGDIFPTVDQNNKKSAAELITRIYKPDVELCSDTDTDLAVEDTIPSLSHSFSQNDEGAPQATPYHICFHSDEDTLSENTVAGDTEQDDVQIFEPKEYNCSDDYNVAPIVQRDDDKFLPLNNATDKDHTFAPTDNQYEDSKFAPISDQCTDEKFAPKENHCNSNCKFTSTNNQYDDRKFTQTDNECAETRAFTPNDDQLHDQKFVPMKHLQDEDDIAVPKSDHYDAPADEQSNKDKIHIQIESNNHYDAPTDERSNDTKFLPPSVTSDGGSIAPSHQSENAEVTSQLLVCTETDSVTSKPVKLTLQNTADDDVHAKQQDTAKQSDLVDKTANIQLSTTLPEHNTLPENYSNEETEDDVMPIPVIGRYRGNNNDCTPKQKLLPTPLLYNSKRSPLRRRISGKLSNDAIVDVSDQQFHTNPMTVTKQRSTGAVAAILQAESKTSITKNTSETAVISPKVKKSFSQIGIRKTTPLSKASSPTAKSKTFDPKDVDSYRDLPNNLIKFVALKRKLSGLDEIYHPQSSSNLNNQQQLKDKDSQFLSGHEHW